MKQIRILDTTLRDGEQTPGVRLGVSQKLEIARQLCRLGVDALEAGFPASSEGDFKAVCETAAQCGCVVQALARAWKSDIDSAAAALAEAKNPRIHVFLASSDIHLRYKLKISREEAIARVADSVKYAKSLCPQVQFSPEDATRSERAFLCRMVETAIAAGADIVNIPDTVGYSTPEEIAALIKYLKENAAGAERVPFSVHCHNDLGLAVANSLAALGAGADQVECTVNGMGERAGNASLEELVMAIRVRGTAFDAMTGINTKEIIRTSRIVSTLSGVPVPQGKAVVGANAFAHEAGIHQHGVMENRETYEIMKPGDIGLDKSTMVLGKLSGRHAFAERIAALGYSLDEAALDATFTRFKEIADKKTNLSDGDLHAIINEYLDGLQGKFRIETFQIQSGNHMKAMALISLRAEGEIFTEAAPGDGPIDAAFNAVNRIAKSEALKLESYEIRAVTEGADALGEVKVVVSTPAHGSFVGRGISTDIIKASIKAYLNAVNKWTAAHQ